MHETDLPSKDALLAQLMPRLSARGIARRWGLLPAPHTALIRECKRLRAAPGFAPDFKQYLGTNPIIRESIETMLAHFARLRTFAGNLCPKSSNRSQGVGGT